MPYKDAAQQREYDRLYARKRKERPERQSYESGYYLRNRAKYLKQARAGRLRMYGLTQEDYDRKLGEQGGVCAICAREPEAGKNLCVDHDHETGKARSLLCRRCNTAIGQLNDDPTLLEKAAEYLKRWDRAALDPFK